MNRRDTLTGTLLVVISAISFGALPLFAHFAYHDGVTPVSLLFLRFTIAGVLMVLLAVARRERFPTGRMLLGFALMGGIGYVGQSYTVFKALTVADTGLVVLLLYLFPAIVAGLSAIFLRERLSAQQLAAIAIALVGTGLTVGPRLEGRTLGVVLSIAAAVIYSVYIMVGNRLLRGAPPISSSAVIMCGAALVFGVLALSDGLTLPTSVKGWSGVLGVAIVAGVVAITTFLAGLKLIGATKASVLSTVEPVSAVALAALFLGEPIRPTTIAGGALIILGVLLLSRKQPSGG